MNLSHLKVFGCKAFADINKHKRRKFDDRAVEGIFVGHNLRSTGYRINTGNGKVIISQSVKFFESDSKTANQQSDALKEDEIQFQELDNFEQSEIQSISNNQDVITNDETEESPEMKSDVSCGSITKINVSDEWISLGNQPVRRSQRNTDGIPPKRLTLIVEENCGI